MLSSRDSLQSELGHLYLDEDDFIQSCRMQYHLWTQLPQNFLLYNVLQRELWPHVPQEIQGKVITVHCLSNWIFTCRNRSSLVPKTCCPDLCHISDCWSSLIIFYCSRVNLIFPLNVEDLKVLILDKKEIGLQSDQLNTPLRHSLPLDLQKKACKLLTCIKWGGQGWKIRWKPQIWCSIMFIHVS